MVVEPMRAASDRRVSQITVVAPAQLMKSDYCVSLTRHGAALNGDDVLFWEPDLETCPAVSQDEDSRGRVRRRRAGAD